MSKGKAVQDSGPKHILDGYRVLDFTQYLAGPTTTRLMAEMGAEVIKVELAPEGDATRALPHRRKGRSGYYIQQNRGKKSVCVDLRNPRGVELIKGLVKDCDVLLENFSPGAIGRLGLGLRRRQGAQPADHHVFHLRLWPDWPAGKTAWL